MKIFVFSIKINIAKKDSSRQTIFSEGDEANGFYILVSGRIKIFKLSSEGKEQILHIFESGEPFGEAAVFAGETFPAYAETLSRILSKMASQGFMQVQGRKIKLLDSKALKDLASGKKFLL